MTTLPNLAPRSKNTTAVNARLAAPLLQRACACGQHSYGAGECADCQKKRSGLQRSATANGPTVAPPIVHDVLRSSGQPLSAATRALMEPRFGRDFSGVRVHTGGQAAESAQAVNALAYTVGRNVVFGAGQYAPATRAGQQLMAHELTHVVQQEGASATGSVQCAASNGELEAQAKHNEQAPQPATPAAGNQMLQRQEAGEAEPLEQPASPIYMLKVPPAIQQQSLTCWAAALSSWLEARGTDKQSFTDIIMRYAGTGCIDTQNALYYKTAPEVFAEWGVTFRQFSGKRVITYTRLREMLEQHGHLLLAQTGSSLGHVLVVYGVGVDDKRMPNDNYMSVMDPLSGKHDNRLISGLSYPVDLGRAGTRTRPAPCLATAGEDPAP